MVSRFVEENVGLEKHSPGEGELHLPTIRQAANCLSLAFIREPNWSECINNFLLVGEGTLVSEDELKNRSVFLAWDEG
jgi:hypothetical protein